MHTYNRIGILGMEDSPFWVGAVELIPVSMVWSGSVIGSAMPSATSCTR